MTASPETAVPYWAEDASAVMARLGTSAAGLPSAEAERRRAAGEAAAVTESEAWRALRLLVRQFNSPLVLILLFGAGLSVMLRGWVDALILVTILLTTGFLGFVQEYRASRALKALERRLALKARVRRDGQTVTVAAATIVPGDVIQLSAGALIPADGILLAATDFLVTEAALTGESLPVEKRPGLAEAEAPLSRRGNCVFAGTSVRSGFADVLVVATGARTQLGGIAAVLESAEPQTDFERGVRRFGNLLLRVMFVLVVAVVVTNSAMGRPVIESALFAVALAVGMTPELLPAIISVTLAAGAHELARRGVLVRRLAALENLGSMDILCTDKTGTLTEGTLTLAGAIDHRGEPGDDVLRLALLNAHFETGIENPLDEAILDAGRARSLDVGTMQKIDEIPYDFVRKRLTIVVADGGGRRTIISKGALPSVLDVCSRVATAAGAMPLDAAGRQELLDLLAAKGRLGYRVLAVASRAADSKPDYDIGDETDLTFAGLLLFADPPKADAARTLAELRALGVATKIISGDNQEVVTHVARAIGLSPAAVLTGPAIAAMSAEALAASADRADIFCEIDPQQKERIIRALQQRGHVVGYLGDGINDAPALHTADVGISVDKAVDVARQSADLVLLERDLGVIRTGIECGRRTFANTQKYIAITTSANFGNMLSMAVATPFLPFLPLQAKQVLLNNFLSDIPSVAISTDTVEPETTRRAEHWNIAELRRFMIVFGLVSSLFDLATFGYLLAISHAGEREFQTSWFVVSLLTETLVVLSLRSRGPWLANRPSLPLLGTTLAVASLTPLLPYAEPLRALFGFVPLRPAETLGLMAIAVAYVAVTELMKRWFYRGDRRP